MRILITGVLGFIGSHLWRIAKRRGYDVVATARYSNGKHLERIADLAPTGKEVHWCDLSNRGQLSGLCEHVDGVIHCAAKTFVDHSIRDPLPFFENNVVSTMNLLEDARVHGVKRFIQVSTDEVYGPILEGRHTEESPLNPSNPYSASKAAAEVLAMSYYTTYGMETLVTRTENNYGRWQDRKVLPVFVAKALRNEPLPVYGDGAHRRQWLRVEDHCCGLLHVLEYGQPGEIYNIAGEEELQNLDLAKMVLRLLGKPEDQFVLVEDRDVRPGHDRRYAIDSQKLRDTGWAPSWTLTSGLEDAVRWYRRHPKWSRL